ncbi:MAG TPA: hypothetical protein VGM30_24970, partial [Puia sp.]
VALVDCTQGFPEAVVMYQRSAGKKAFGLKAVAVVTIPNTTTALSINFEIFITLYCFLESKNNKNF